MNVIETAKIIAARIRFRDRPPPASPTAMTPPSPSVTETVSPNPSRKREACAVTFPRISPADLDGSRWESGSSG